MRYFCHPKCLCTVVEEDQDLEFDLDIDDAYVDESRPEEGTEEDSLYMHKKFTPDPGQKIMRLDQWLFSLMRNKSRTQIKNAALAGCVRVNGKVIKASYKVKPGDEVTIMLPHPPPPQLGPEDIPVDIAYEDDDFMMVNKTPNMVVHPGVGNWTGTMLHGLLFHLNKDRLEAPREEWVFPQLVHRIDKDTSGLLVVPKHDFSNQFIARQFYERTIDRLYNAIVWGDVKQDEGTIVGHVGRSKGDRKKFTVYTDGSLGKRAITHYKVLERFGFATLVQCKLETGRTHQIRVHMKHIGHTLFSDWFYGGHEVLANPHTPKWNAFITNVMEILPRQALHARTLGFVHPQTRKKVFFDSELPEDFQLALEKMRAYRDTYISPPASGK
ncbi:MAG: RluA family pseudouridine synthase [Bacteroidetes bacterium]|nr:RluA family pseudouridine synthase [Bacteroidota bacterium]MBL0016409.1 RluA family pseudouridine synthase [Bacteroidota bacterium]